MEERRRRSRLRYEIIVGGTVWCRAAKKDLAESAADSARRTWARGRRVEVRDNPSSPFWSLTTEVAG